MTLKLIVAAALLFVFGTIHEQFSDPAQHQTHASGPDMTPELDNETVEVVRIRLEPHQKVPMHTVTPRVVVWLTDAHLRATGADGISREEYGKPGQVEWVPAQQHAAENLDDHAVEFIAVIPKAPGNTEKAR